MIHPLVVEARNTPPAPGAAAFFDLDRTLIHGFTARAFLRERLRGGHVTSRALLGTLRDTASFRAGRMGFSSFLVRAAELYAGMPEAELERIGADIFRRRAAGAIYPEAYALFRAHRDAGRTTVVVTSATRYQAEPVAAALGADHLLCSRLEVDAEGRLTGRVERPTCYGVGKRRAAEELAEAHGLDLSQCTFYTDGLEDRPLLEAVGHPRPVNPDRGLARLARRKGWPVHRFHTRGARAEPVVRTALGVGSMVASAAAGIPFLLAGASLDQARNLTKALFGEVGTAVAGIDLEVDGEHHLWSHRPAVFVFNHQSAVEPMLLCKLLRRDFVGIAKAELQGSVFRPLFDYAGAVYIERFDRTRALEALAPVVEALQGGTSIIIAPEGTRSPTPRPGPFKKGAFHIAMQAGVPIVPIVFHNSLDALPRKGRVVHGTTVRVTILPPLDSTGWTPEDAGAQADALHRRYEEVLGYA
jgi:putative phosphoserine phosphatase / 1-acylglycerol-3-phosphate O-acyltransferase